MTAKKVSQLASTPRGYDPRTRYGWWNTPNDNDADAAAKVSDLDELSVDNATQEASSSSAEAPIQLPPVEHPSNGFPIQTLLEPSPETLHKQNRPLSELHPATSLAQALPFCCGSFCHGLACVRLSNGIATRSGAQLRRRPQTHFNFVLVCHIAAPKLVEHAQTMSET